MNMRRRKFLQNIAWFSGGMLLYRCTPAKALLPSNKTIKGRIVSSGKLVKNVVVSDGYTVVTTSGKGAFEFVPHPDAVSLFISTPAGYAFIQQDGIARHYRLLQDIELDKEIQFELTPLPKDDNEHEFIIWADPQVRNASDVKMMMEQSVPDVQKYVQSRPANTLIHGITVGDIAWDNLEHFADYDKAVAKMGIPFFQVIGNHDMDFRKGGDETSDDTFCKTYGPTHYSFNRGEAHYVVLDNVRYLGTERDYDGYIQQNQLEWLKKDLSHVAMDKLVIVCLHIPVHLATKNKEALYELLKDRNVHIMSGHTHWHENVMDNNIYEHNHGTVCGAWWTGDICADGTPNGYAIYKVKGKELSWHYQATGKPADYQMKIHEVGTAGNNKQVLVNIWNYDPAWTTQYFIDEVPHGALEQTEGFDPVAYKKMLGPDLPKPRGFAEPKKTNHLFAASVPLTANSIKVVATDRFGKTYTASHTMKTV